MRSIYIQPVHRFLQFECLGTDANRSNSSPEEGRTKRVFCVLGGRGECGRGVIEDLVRYQSEFTR